MPQAHAVPRPRNREIELLLSLARTEVPGQDRSRARALVAAGVDWNLLLRAAAPQGVLPLVYANLQTHCPGALPSEFGEGLREQVRGLARSNVVRAGYLVRLVQAFGGAGVDVLPFKGPALLAQAYPDMALRPFGDLDLLVRARDVPRARDLLLGLRFQMAGSEAWEWDFVDPSGTITVDLHERIASRYFPVPATFDELWQRRRPVLVCGAPVPAMSPEDLLLTLAIQWAKDCREWKQRLIQACDGAELLRRQPDLDWRLVAARARARGAERILHLYLFVARTLLQADLPPALWDLVRADAKACALGEEVQARMFPEAQSLPEAARFRSEIYVEDSAFYLRSRERFRDRLDYLWRYSAVHAGLLFRPSALDHAFMRLPRRLEPLYYLVRPLRIANDWLRGTNKRAAPDPAEADPPGADRVNPYHSQESAR
jgi:putative nucleotidyltransferase-like protein